ncbi:hypothetical protein CVIRNUC_009642 [Coccomyxa viridis]|uniref:Uncharacterized protein n=1 Tax=Coccomyxa viridis TaxID=1274662 RepID=A0AAV1IH64_9CHLO|nr:hypothetical protein CVIRNUC_009642 [Coccomyxa viridis]
MPLSATDKALARLFMAATFHHWDILPELGRKCYAEGASLEEIRSCVRHLIVVAGYGPCLAATNHLHAAKLLEGDSPGKVGGAPGNAFELVYTSVTDTVRERMHAVDPVLAEYIRRHLYGDIYSSPGLSLAQRQVLMCAFLGEANMHEQLFGHLLAAMRFGNDLEACLKAIQIGFELSPRPSDSVYQGAVKTLEMAYRKFKKEHPDGATHLPTVTVPEPDSIKIPALYLRTEAPLSAEEADPTCEDDCKRPSIAASDSHLRSAPSLRSLKSAGASHAQEAMSRLKLERSGPSGNLSKLYNLKVRAFSPAEGETQPALPSRSSLGSATSNLAPT